MPGKNIGKPEENRRKTGGKPWIPVRFQWRK
jgi:hypothetical protein